MIAPQCVRCGASTADRAYVGFTGGDGEQAEAYCTGCLTPEQVQMVLGFVKSQSVPDD